MIKIQKKNWWVFLPIVFVVFCAIFFISLYINKDDSRANFDDFILNDLHLVCGQSSSLSYSSDNQIEIISISIDNENVAVVKDFLVYAVHSGTTNAVVNAKDKYNSYIKSCNIVVTPSVDNLNLQLENTKLYLLDKEFDSAYQDKIYNYVDVVSDYELDVEISDDSILEYDENLNKIKALNVGLCQVKFICLADPCYYETVNITVELPPLSVECENEVEILNKENIDIQISYSIPYYYGNLKIIVDDENIVSVSLVKGKLIIYGQRVGSSFINIYYGNDKIKTIKVIVKEHTPTLTITYNENEITDNKIVTTENKFYISVTLDYEYQEISVIEANGFEVTKISDAHFKILLNEKGHYTFSFIVDSDLVYEITIEYV